MKKFLFCIGCITTILSCNTPQLEERLSKLEKKVGIEEGDSIQMLKYKTGLLMENEKIKSEKNEYESYWDIQVAEDEKEKGIHFVYHRKNAGEMWQPIASVYSSNNYVRILDYGVSGNEYLIVTLNYDQKKVRQVYE